MSDPYNPTPWLVPPPDGVQRPLSINRQTVIPGDASNSDAGVLMTVADEIVSGNSNMIDRFVNNARQSHSQSGRNYSHATRDLDGVRLRHSINNGFERLDMQVFPYGGSSQSNHQTDTNLDGYIVWVSSQYQLKINGVTQPIPSVRILMNGYLIEEAFTPETHSGGYVFAFGKTALVLPSLAQSLTDANPLIADRNYVKPSPVLPSPGWGTNKGDALDNTALDKQPRELGYWLFDWTNPYNPGQYVNVTNSYGAPPVYQAWQSGTGWEFPLGQLQLTKGIYFPNTTKSILLPRGQNGIACIPSSNPDNSGIVDVFFGEFFDRGKYRVVKKSWKLAAKPGSTISINDYPNRYLGSTLFTSYGYPGSGVMMDLSAKFSADPANLTNGPATNQMSTLSTSGSTVLGSANAVVQGFGDPNVVPPGLTLLQYQQVLAWAKNNYDAQVNYNANHAADLAAALAALIAVTSEYTQAHELAFMARSIAGDYSLYLTQWPDDRILYTALGNVDPNAPIVYPQAGGPFPDASYYEDGVGPITILWVLPANIADGLNYFTANPHSAGVYFNAPFSRPEIPGSGIDYSQAAFGNPPFYFPASSNGAVLAAMNDFIQSAVTAYNAALAHYNELLGQKGPDLLPFPDIGDDLSKFTYSNITISGSSWSYKQ